MTQLQKDYPWLGLLEVRVAAEAWALGVEAARHISRNEESNKERISS
jgi:hypothetical protein